MEIILNKFDALPLWAQILTLLFAVYIFTRGVLDRVVAPLGDALNQINITLTRIAQWVQRTLFPPATETPVDPPSPVRVIPEEQTVWESKAIPNPLRPLPKSIPIITVANMKGGVGKTTIAANLAPFFRREYGKPVLTIDFDYQGSLSQCIRGEAGYTDPDITADVLLGTSPDDPLLFAREMRRAVEDIFIFPTHYPFATIENNLLAAWLSGHHPNLMYRLCEQLRRPEVQEKFGAVLIDSPPRLTPGSINALCASTHLLVPTTLDDMSAQAAQYFLDQITRMKEQVFPALRVIGVVPTLVHRDGSYQEQEERALQLLREYGRETFSRDDFVLDEGELFRRVDIAKYAGIGVAYTRNAAAREQFDRLGAAIKRRF